MLPTDQQIRPTANRIWEIKGGGHGHDLADWLEAKDDVTLDLNYEQVAGRWLAGIPKAYLPMRQASPRTCCYCRKSEPHVSFRLEAHAIPEFLGNRAALSWDECDRCNTFFGETIEDHCAKFTLSMRAFNGVSGKRGVPSYKSMDATVRMDFDATKTMFEIFDGGPERTFHYDEENGEVRTSLDCQPYVPLAVLKCFTKMAIAIMPENDLPYYRRACRWLLEPDHRVESQYLRTYKCRFYFLPQSFKQPWAVLWRRKSDDVPLPYMLFAFCTGRLHFQIPVPLCDKEDSLDGQTIAVPRAGLLTYPHYLVTCEPHAISLGSPDLVRDAQFQTVLKIDSNMPLTWTPPPSVAPEQQVS